MYLAFIFTALSLMKLYPLNYRRVKPLFGLKGTLKQIIPPLKAQLKLFYDYKMFSIHSIVEKVIKNFDPQL